MFLEEPFELEMTTEALEAIGIDTAALSAEEIAALAAFLLV